MTDEQRQTVTLVPLAGMTARRARVDGVWYGDVDHCPVCGRAATHSVHAGRMPRLQIECQAHPELNPMGWTLEELEEQWAALKRWRDAERRQHPEAYG